jgi:hypothetical protein
MILYNICLCSKRHSGTRDSDSHAQHHTPIRTSVIAQIYLKSSYTDIYTLLGQRPVLSARHLLLNLSLWLIKNHSVFEFRQGRENSPKRPGRLCDPPSLTCERSWDRETLTIRFHLLSSLRMSGGIPLFPL